MSHISDLGFALAIADGQLSNALKEVQRWRAREMEARAMRKAAEQMVAKHQRQIEQAVQQIEYQYGARA